MLVFKIPGLAQKSQTLVKRTHILNGKKLYPQKRLQSVIETILQLNSRFLQ